MIVSPRRGAEWLHLASMDSRLHQTGFGVKSHKRITARPCRGMSDPTKGLCGFLGERGRVLGSIYGCAVALIRIRGAGAVALKDG